MPVMQMDAFERLMHLPLKGEAERDIVRVILDCCMQEATWNPYYAHVAAKVAAAAKNHRMTLQYAVWDKLKTLSELNLRQLTNLAHFLASLFSVQVCYSEAFAKTRSNISLDRLILHIAKIHCKNILKKWGELTKHLG